MSDQQYCVIISDSNEDDDEIKVMSEAEFFKFLQQSIELRDNNKFSPYIQVHKMQGEPVIKMKESHPKD